MYISHVGYDVWYNTVHSVEARDTRRRMKEDGCTISSIEEDKGF